MAKSYKALGEIDKAVIVLDSIDVKTDFNCLDFNKLTLEEIYKYLENISNVFYRKIMSDSKVWKK